MALLWKMICNLGDPMRLGHPVRLLWVMTCANVTIESCLMMACDLTYDVSPYDNQPLRPPLSVFLSCLLSFFLSFFLFYTGGYQNAFRCFSKENLEIFLFCWYLKSMTWCYKWFHSYIVRESRVANTLDGSDFDILPINKKQIHSHGKKKHIIRQSCGTNTLDVLDFDIIPTNKKKAHSREQHKYMVRESRGANSLDVSDFEIIPANKTNNAYAPRIFSLFSRVRIPLDNYDWTRT